MLQSIIIFIARKTYGDNIYIDCHKKVNFIDNKPGKFCEMHNNDLLGIDIIESSFSANTCEELQRH